MPDLPKVQSMADMLDWLDHLEQAASVQTTGAWPLATVLDHLAQSIEMSMDGFPQPKGAWFQKTVGAAAFGLFRWRGRMSHGLNQPIPGAPGLASGPDWRPAADRLRRAIARFEAHAGGMQPHFAYGPLSKADYAAAHSMHVANHQDEIRVS